MTPLKFFLRYTALPLMGFIIFVSWTLTPAFGEIDARQYAAFSEAYAGFPLSLRSHIAGALKSGKLSKWDDSTLERQALSDGFVLDWPTNNVKTVAIERTKLIALIKADRLLDLETP